MLQHIQRTLGTVLDVHEIDRTSYLPTSSARIEASSRCAALLAALFAYAACLRAVPFKCGRRTWQKNDLLSHAFKATHSKKFQKV
jgi:hypothetical protein